MSAFYVIGTPIGNLEDITLRALRVLQEVDLVLCEDTRVTHRLFQKYNISTPVQSYHTHSGEAKVDLILERIKEGKSLALVTDAGTPGISDPGSLLVSKIRESYPDLAIIAIPGASALTSALSIAGIPTHEFVFLGFMPHKKGRETIFNEIGNTARTVVFYESTHRIVRTLESLVAHLQDSKKVTLVREISKIYEEVIQGTAADVLAKLSSTPHKQKGEFVVIVSVI